jgi:hypothetical protein
MKEWICMGLKWCLRVKRCRIIYFIHRSFRLVAYIFFFLMTNLIMVLILQVFFYVLSFEIYFSIRDILKSFFFFFFSFCLSFVKLIPFYILPLIKDALESFFIFIFSCSFYDTSIFFDIFLLGEF